MIKYYVDIEQGTEEWHELRKGKLTASHATEIGANGAGLKTYVKRIITDIYAEPEEVYINSAMERGNELEPIARNYYEFETGNTVEQVGFVENSKYPNIGCSPDGLVGIVGGIEIKARNNEKHLSLILGETKEIPFNQIQMTLLITEREWWDFVSYNPNFKENSLFIKRIYPDLVYFEKLKKGFGAGTELFKEYTEKFKNYKITI